MRNFVLHQIRGMCLKRYETDSPLWVRRMASENIMDTSISLNLKKKEKKRDSDISDNYI
jgi:hypothetical protein